MVHLKRLFMKNFRKLSKVYRSRNKSGRSAQAKVQKSMLNWTRCPKGCTRRLSSIIPRRKRAVRRFSRQSSERRAVLEARSEMESASDTRFAFNPQAPSHQCDELIRNSQAQTCSTVSPGGGSICLRKGFEYGFLLLRRDADARIGDSEMQERLLSETCSVVTDSVTLPLLVNLMALSVRFSNTCRSRSGSPISLFGNSGSKWAFRDRVLLPGPERDDRISSSIEVGTWKDVFSSVSFRASIFEKSRMSLTIARSESLDILTLPDIPAVRRSARC